MDRSYLLENLRRSLAMEPPRSKVALYTDDYDNLIREVQDLRRRLDNLQRGLAQLVEAIAAEW